MNPTCDHYRAKIRCAESIRVLDTYSRAACTNMYYNITDTHVYNLYHTRVLENKPQIFFYFPRFVMISVQSLYEFFRTLYK